MINTDEANIRISMKNGYLNVTIDKHIKIQDAISILNAVVAILEQKPESENGAEAPREPVYSN